MKEKKKEKKESSANADFYDMPIFIEKNKPKITDQVPCPICGGCVWFIGDKYKCGWCGYDGINTNQSRALKR